MAVNGKAPLIASDATVDDVRRAIVELIGAEASSAIVIASQLCDLWQKWLDYKCEDEPQRYYMAMAALKQFNLIWLRLDPNAKKPEDNDRANRQLKVHRDKVLDDQDDLQQFLPAKKQA